MHGGLPFIGISTLIYGVVGLVVLAVSVVRTRIGDSGESADIGGVAGRGRNGGRSGGETAGHQVTSGGAAR